MTPRISVIMAVYNTEKYVGQAIKSILKQTYSSFEFIIINDASTDRSLDIIRKFEQKDARIKVISNKTNLGISRSRNKGLEIAAGEFMAVMDSDDVCMPERFQRQIAFLSKNPDYVGVGSEALMVDPEGWPLKKRGHFYDNEGINQRLLKAEGGAITHPSLFCRLSAVNLVGGYDEDFSTTVDLDLYLRLAEVGKLANLKEILIKWRQHTKSVNHTKYATWESLRHRALIKTMKRRNIYIELNDIFVGSMYKEDYRLHWARMALRSNYYHTTIKNFLFSIAANGFKRKHLGFIKTISRDVWRKLRRAIDKSRMI